MTINNNSGKLFTARFWALVALSLISCLLFLWLAWEVIAEKGEWLDTLGWNYVQGWWLTLSLICIKLTRI